MGSALLEAVLPDTVDTVLSRFWMRPTRATDGCYFEESQGAEVFLNVHRWSHGVTLCEESTPLCAWGITPYWPGVGTAWLFRRSPQAMAQHGTIIARHMRRVWNQWFASGAYRWIETVAEDGDPAIRRLLLWIGFQVIALKPGYGSHGQDKVEYAWKVEA